ncbi:type II toxin-antitoxin system RelE/ParE family toxin [Candidatus Woesearchaeota archaeon]|nr:type II toxin-antitoxin system RelE/ParE family toxin [Candidatus Woesearchaeota archaeon]
MYQIVLGKKAEKDLNKITRKHKPQIIAALFDLRENAYLGKSLKGKFSGYYSLRVWPYRIIYKVNRKKLIIFIIRIGHRQGIYR